MLLKRFDDGDSKLNQLVQSEKRIHDFRGCVLPISNGFGSICSLCDLRPELLVSEIQQYATHHKAA